MTLKERFARNLQLPTDTAPSAGVNLPTAAVLKDMAGKAAELEDRSPPATLPEDRRASIAREMSRLVVPALERCAEGLANHPEITKVLGVTASSCQSTAQIISATAKLAKNAGDAHDGSADGLRLVAGESQDLGEQVLSGVYRMIKAADPQVDVVLLDTAFSDAFRKYQEAADRDKRLRNYSGQAVADQKARAEEARRKTQDVSAIDRFLSDEKKE